MRVTERRVVYATLVGGLALLSLACAAPRPASDGGDLDAPPAEPRDAGAPGLDAPADLDVGAPCAGTAMLSGALFGIDGATLLEAAASVQSCMGTTVWIALRAPSAPPESPAAIAVEVPLPDVNLVAITTPVLDRDVDVVVWGSVLAGERVGGRFHLDRADPVSLTLAPPAHFVGTLDVALPDGTHFAGTLDAVYCRSSVCL